MEQTAEHIDLSNMRGPNLYGLQTVRKGLQCSVLRRSRSKVSYAYIRLHGFFCMCEPWYRWIWDAAEGKYSESGRGHDGFHEVALGSPESKTTKPLVSATGRMQRENNTLRGQLAVFESVSTQAIPSLLFSSCWLCHLTKYTSGHIRAVPLNYQTGQSSGLETSSATTLDRAICAVSHKRATALIVAKGCTCCVNSVSHQLPAVAFATPLRFQASHTHKLLLLTHCTHNLGF